MEGRLKVQNFIMQHVKYEYKINVLFFILLIGETNLKCCKQGKLTSIVHTCAFLECFLILCHEVGNVFS